MVRYQSEGPNTLTVGMLMGFSPGYSESISQNHRAVKSPALARLSKDVADQRLGRLNWAENASRPHSGNSHDSRRSGPTL
jgi:hypothetical protein